MANEFKAAAERKKRLTEVRKAERTIEQIEAFMQERRDILSVGAAETLQNAADKLSEVVKDADAGIGSIAALNDEAQAAFEMAVNALENQPENQQEETPAEISEDIPVTEAAEQEQKGTPTNEEVPEEKTSQEEETQEIMEPVGERVADVLRRMYAAPRYSRVGGETKARFSALIKPSLRAKMDEDAKAGKIKSPNDLINVLLEIYYGEE